MSFYQIKKKKLFQNKMKRKTKKKSKLLIKYKIFSVNFNKNWMNAINQNYLSFDLIIRLCFDLNPVLTRNIANYRLNCSINLQYCRFYRSFYLYSFFMNSRTFKANPCFKSIIHSFFFIYHLYSSLKAIIHWLFIAVI